MSYKISKLNLLWFLKLIKPLLADYFLVCFLPKYSKSKLENICVYIYACRHINTHIRIHIDYACTDMFV